MQESDSKSPPHQYYASRTRSTGRYLRNGDDNQMKYLVYDGVKALPDLVVVFPSPEQSPLEYPHLARRAKRKVLMRVDRLLMKGFGKGKNPIQIRLVESNSTIGTE